MGTSMNRRTATFRFVLIKCYFGFKTKRTDHNYISFTDLNVCFKMLSVFGDNLQSEEMMQGISLYRGWRNSSISLPACITNSTTSLSEACMILISWKSNGLRNVSQFIKISFSWTYHFLVIRLSITEIDRPSMKSRLCRHIRQP